MKNKRGKIIAVIAAVLLIAGGTGAAFALKERYKPSDTILSIAQSKKENRYFMPVSLIAHRGFSAIAPENTLAAAKAAGEAAFYGCEFDVRLGADGVWYVMHDADVARMTDGEGLLSEMNGAQIAALTIDAGNNVIQHDHEKVPTAREMLAMIDAQPGLRPVIEIKTSGADAKAYADLAQEIRDFASGEYQISSFDLDVLDQMRALLPDASVWLLTSKVTTEQIRTCAEHGVTGMSFDASNPLNLRYADDIADADMLVAAWTVDNIRLLDKLYGKGVYYITTNVIQPA